MPEDKSSTNDKANSRAIALQYESADELPHVIASGQGEAALKIIQAAEKAGVPISRDEDLSELLSSLPVGSSISPEMYKLVAHVIAFLYHSDKEWREKHGFLNSILNPED